MVTKKKLENKVTFSFINQSFKSSQIISIYAKSVLEIGLWQSEKSLLLNYFNTDDNILILGCGAGRVPIGLYRLGFKNLTGIDLSKGMIKKAKKFVRENNFNIEFFVCNALELTYKFSIFNGIFMPYNLLMHIPYYDNRLKVLKESRKILLNGSTLIFTTHDDRNNSNEWKKFWIDEQKRWLSSKQDERLFEFGDRIIMDKGSEIFMHFPTYDEVIKLIKDSGFILVDTKLRSEICIESDNVLSYSRDCRFWIVLTESSNS